MGFADTPGGFGGSCQLASWRVMSGPGRPGGVGGDDHLVRVAGGFDLLQAAVGGGRKHRAGWGRGLFEVVVVVAGVPRAEGVLDRVCLRARRISSAVTTPMPPP